MNNRKNGEYWESEAAKYLESKGMTIIERNYRCKIGEIDIIAKDKDVYVFVEVKYRRTQSVGYALEAVTPAKQKTIRKVAAFYMTVVLKSQYIPCRFDVIGFDTIDNKIHISHICDAF